MKEVIKVFYKVCRIITLCELAVCCLAYFLSFVFIASYGFLISMFVCGFFVPGFFLCEYYYNKAMESLETDQKAIWIGVLSLIFMVPPAGILYLIWQPDKKEETEYNEDDAQDADFKEEYN